MTKQTGASMLTESDERDFHAASDRVEPHEQALRLKEAIKRGGGNTVVAQRAGISISTLSNYVAGRDMKTSNMVAIARACGVSIAWLAAGEGPMVLSSQMQPPTQPEPRNSEPPRRLGAFATIKVDVMTAAMQDAAARFAEAGGEPTTRDLVQAALLIYDMMNKP